MPLGWKPEIRKIEQLIQEEEARTEVLKQQKQITSPSWQPQAAPVSFAPTNVIKEKPFAVPPIITPTPPIIPEPSVPEPSTPSYTPPPNLPAPLVAPEEKVEIDVPFWKRGLQIFAAPFEWVDENVILPGLALAGTTAGLVPQVERKPGEDFWEWKKRSWEGWETPGVNLNVPWSDEDVRVDVKGILEFAPWLLLPGAGQVGTGARAGIGIAGALGKAGKVGEVLGRTVEVSPWGLVEKTAGVAIKGGIRAVGSASEKVSTSVGEKLFGKYVPPPVTPAVAKFTQITKEVIIPQRKAFEEALPTELRAKQLANLEKVHEKYLNGQVSLEDFQKAQSEATAVGALRPQFAVKPEQMTFTPDETKEIVDTIISSVENGYTKKEAADSFLNLVTGTLDNLPEPAVLRAWGRVFGEEFAQAIGKFRTPVQLNSFMDALQIGKSTISAYDMSGTFRQALFFNLLHPTLTPKWIGRQVKALLSEKLSLDMNDSLMARPVTKDFLKRGGYLRPMTESSAIHAEEAFPSRIARHFPGVKRSERGFATMLNEASIDTYERGFNVMKALGSPEKDFDLWAQFISIAGGRGVMPKSLEKYAPALNAIAFSPRLQLSLLQLPRQLARMLMSGNPYMRKEAAKALVTFVGGGVGIISLLNLTGKAKTSIDPRSGDFGKIIVGDPKTGTRIDIWRGYVQYIRFAAQLLSGERKSAYGNMNKAERGEIVSRFLQSKASPAVGMLGDLFRGETYEGKPIFNDTTGFSDAAMQRIVPLALQDIIDAMEANGINGLWTAAPATLGLGVLTYVNDFVRVKDKIAKQMGYDTWDEIDPKTQREIQNTNAELQAAQIAFDRQVMGTAWGDYRSAGNAIENVFRDNVEKAVAEYQKTGNGTQFNDKVTDAFTARRGGYAARDQEERFSDIVKRLKVKNTAESLVKLGPEQVAIKTYNDALFGDDMYDEFGNYRFEEATIRKAQLTQALGVDAMKYIEDYQGIKYDTFPQEFQDLMQAREVMRPYWEVRTRVIKLFGEKFADSSKGQSLISKIRKGKRLSNPDIERAFQRFYAG